MEKLKNKKDDGFKTRDHYKEVEELGILFSYFHERNLNLLISWRFCWWCSPISLSGSIPISIAKSELEQKDYNKYQLEKIGVTVFHFLIPDHALYN